MTDDFSSQPYSAAKIALSVSNKNSNTDESNFYLCGMKKLIPFLIILVFQISCRKNPDVSEGSVRANNSIKYAQGLRIEKFIGYSIIKISDPWPGSTESYTYICKKKNGIVPDSLSKYPIINVPLSSIAVTSTTHIPPLEVLGVSDRLTGFPNLDYISSEVVRKRIDQGKIKDISSGANLNNEIVIDIAPDVIIGHGIDNKNPSLENLRKSGLNVIFNGDWNEKSPLGNAEWIKLFGTLFGLESKADSIFIAIENEYHLAQALVADVETRPTVLSGALYENTWFLPQGNSWGSLLVKDAGGKYLWAETKGSGSLALPFEQVLEKAANAEFWIGPAEHQSLAGMLESNPHYAQFKAFKNKNVYSFSTKKGKTGGVIYYELSQSRPDLVLKDLIKILHPELLPEYQLVFFEKLK